MQQRVVAGAHVIPIVRLVGIVLALMFVAVRALS